MGIFTTFDYLALLHARAGHVSIHILHRKQSQDWAAVTCYTLPCTNSLTPMNPILWNVIQHCQRDEDVSGCTQSQHPWLHSTPASLAALNPSIHTKQTKCCSRARPAASLLWCASKRALENHKCC